jgi:chromosome segregation ATPase
MVKKNESGLVGLVRGVSARFEEAERTLTTLEDEGKTLQKKLPKLLGDIESCEVTISESDEQISQLQARRNQLRSEYMEASFAGDTETERAIKAERANLDKKLEQHAAERDKAQTNLNRLRSNLHTARENAFTALDELTVPSEENFLDAFIEALRKQTEDVHKRMHAAELLYELPDEREQREESEREAEKAREAAEKAAKRKELVDRRNYYGKLLNNLSHLHEPHTGHRAWVEYLQSHGIEYRTESNGSTTFIGQDDAGKRTRLNPQSIVADVKAEYVKAMHELGEPIEVPERPQSNPRLTRDAWVSVM